MTFLDYLWPDIASNVASYLSRQRWFGGKGRPLQEVRLAETVWLKAPPEGLALLAVECRFADGAPEFYSLFVGFLLGGKAAPVASSAMILPKLSTLSGLAQLYDATADPAACLYLLELFKLKQPLPARFGQVVVQPTPIFAKLRGPGSLSVAPMAGEQSNRSFLFRQGTENRLLLKLFSRLEGGANPDYEISRALTEETSFNAMPPLGGAITYQSHGLETTLAVLFGFEPNDGTAWDASQRQLAEVAAQLPSGEAAPTEDELATLLEGPLAWATRLGQRTAELHKALASVKKAPGFAPEPLTAEDLARLVAGLGEMAGRVEDLWSQPAARAQIRERLSSLAGQEKLGQKLRGHGDLHLGQALTRGGDFILIDFEGEPARPLAERRRKTSPLRDVAGMVRSFDYAASVFLRGLPPAERSRLTPWARGWQDVLTQAFLHGYMETSAEARFLPEDEAAKDALLWLFTLEKALYEVRYEEAHRPDWAEVPRDGLRALLRLAK